MFLKTLFFLLCFALFISVEHIYCLSYNPICWLRECCNDDDIPGNINKLRRVINERVYGQHLTEDIIDALAAHWNPHFTPQKALTLSFHGWPGSGKNYVAKFIAESLYKEGTKSKYVHHLIGRIHFPLKNRAEEYKEELRSWIKSNTSSCGRQLFIFDEVDKIPPTVLDGIKPMIDHHDSVDGVDYRKAIFIFLSNTGMHGINEHYEKMWNSGKHREEVTLKDFESMIQKGAFNEEGGFYRADAIKSNLIDHYIPFLPMQEEHVIQCIKDEFRKRNVNSPSRVHIKEVLDFIEWGPDSSKLFSKTGCKRISSKVMLIVARHYSDASKSEL